MCVFLPFSLSGNSGMGKYHGKHTFDQLSHHRACLIKSLGMESLNKARYPPLTPSRLRRARFFMLRRLCTCAQATCAWAIISTVLALGLLVALLVVLLKVKHSVEQPSFVAHECRFFIVTNMFIAS